MSIKKSIGKLIGLLCVFGLVSNTLAFEIITKDDISEKIVTHSHFIKTAENAIILFDASSSMEKPYKDTGLSRYEIAKKTLMERNEYFPDLGHNIGLYLYTPWTEVYPVQKYNRENFAKALKTLPENTNNPTLLVDGLLKLEGVLEKLKGRTAVFIYTDGSYTKVGHERRKPATIAKEMAEKHDVCFYLVSTADDKSSIKLFDDVESYNFCSRVIPFESFIDHPEYNSEALFTVKATEDIITVTDKKVIAIKTNNFLFDFNKSDLSEGEKQRLAVLATYLKENKTTFAALAGHTDNIGPEDYNLGLSLRRVKSIAFYLVDYHNVNPSQLVAFWFGELNPVGDNTTPEGRMQNRRVEIVVGGM